MRSRIREVAVIRFLVLGAATMLLLGTAPLATAAVLGNPTPGTVTDSGDSNFINGSRFTMPSTGGTASSLSVYVAAVAAAPNNNYQAAIYTDSAGKPALLVASSGTGTLSPNAWNTLPLSASSSPAPRTG